MPHHLPHFRCLLVFIIILLVSRGGGAWHEDTHYYLTFGLAVATCYSWDEAHIIASSNVGVDLNASTVAEISLTKKWNKVHWHAFGHSQEHLNFLWQRVLAEDHLELKLMKLGQFLHFVQDWEAHAGFPRGIGHALATVNGKDPDSLARNEARTDRMVQATLDHMAMLCAELDRLPGGETDSDLALFDDQDEWDQDAIISDLIRRSNPKWRAKGWGALSPEGEQIIADNKLRIEQYIDRHLRAYPPAEIPENFTPGDEELGIPPPIELVFEQDGDLTGELADAVDRERYGSTTSSDVELVYARSKKGAWEVRINVKNNGDEAYPEGNLRIIAADPVEVEELGEVTMPIPTVQPGERRSIDTVIPVSRKSKEVLIGLIAEVGGLGGQNYERWFMTEEDRARFQKRMRDSGRPEDGRLAKRQVEAVHFVGRPKLKMTGTELCLVAYARTDLKDPTDQLEVLEIGLVREDATKATIEGEFSRTWSISGTAAGEKPIAKTFECISLERELCDLADWQSETPRIEITLRADESMTGMALDIDQRILKDVRERCAALEGS